MLSVGEFLGGFEERPAAVSDPCSADVEEGAHGLAVLRRTSSVAGPASAPTWKRSNAISAGPKVSRASGQIRDEEPSSG